jgi:hypothetical protein
MGFKTPRQCLVALLLCALGQPAGVHAQSSLPTPSQPASETLEYSIEWRLITAGIAKLNLVGSHITLKLESSGLVSKLYRVDDVYQTNYDPGFCVTSLELQSQEGRRKRETHVTYDRNRNKADYLERDLVKNAVVKQDQIDIPHCVYDVAGALHALRGARIDVGKSMELPVSDGKKSAAVRVEAQEREELKIKDKPVKTVRYEVFLFNGVIYPRKARLLLWLTDDARKLPVQIRVRMNFPVGTITLTLDKEEHT